MAQVASTSPGVLITAGTWVTSHVTIGFKWVVTGGIDPVHPISSGEATVEQIQTRYTGTIAAGSISATHHGIVVIAIQVGLDATSHVNCGNIGTTVVTVGDGQDPIAIRIISGLIDVIVVTIEEGFDLSQSASLATTVELGSESLQSSAVKPPSQSASSSSMPQWDRCRRSRSTPKSHLDRCRARC